jgi:hypothetical protein
VDKVIKSPRGPLRPRNKWEELLPPAGCLVDTQVLRGRTVKPRGAGEPAGWTQTPAHSFSPCNLEQTVTSESQFPGLQSRGIAPNLNSVYSNGLQCPLHSVPYTLWSSTAHTTAVLTSSTQASDLTSGSSYILWVPWCSHLTGSWLFHQLRLPQGCDVLSLLGHPVLCWALGLRVYPRAKGFRPASPPAWSSRALGEDLEHSLSHLN